MQHQRQLAKLQSLYEVQTQDIHAQQQEICELQHRSSQQAEEIKRLEEKVAAETARADGAEAALHYARRSMLATAHELHLLGRHVAWQDRLIAKLHAENTSGELERRQAALALHKREKLLLKLQPKLERQRAITKAARKRAVRAKESCPVVLKKGVSKAKHFQLKHKGVYKPQVRMGVARLHAEGVSAKSMPKILKIAAEIFEGELDHTIDRRDVARFTAEAGVLADLQLVDEISKAPCQYPTASSHITN
jgi:hypothetical protein